MKHVINLLQELSGYLAGIQNTIEKMVDELGGNVPEVLISQKLIINLLMEKTYVQQDLLLLEKRFICMDGFH